MAHTHYARDPRWITARFGTCAKSGCGKNLAGKRTFYYPATRDAFCEEHGEAESRSFTAAAQDEDFMTRGGCNEFGESY